MTDKFVPAGEMANFLRHSFETRPEEGRQRMPMVLLVVIGFLKTLLFSFFSFTSSSG